MQSESQLNLDSSPHVQVGDKSRSWRMRNIVAFNPNRMRGESYFVSSHRPYADGRLLGIDWTAPEADAFAKGRRAKVIGQIMLYSLGVGSAGLYFIALLPGKDFIPAETLTIILFLAAGISLFVIGIGLASLLHRSTKRTRNVHPKPLFEK